MLVSENQLGLPVVFPKTPARDGEVSLRCDRSELNGTCSSRRPAAAEEEFANALGKVRKGGDGGHGLGLPVGGGVERGEEGVCVGGGFSFPPPANDVTPSDKTSARARGAGGAPGAHTTRS